MNEMRIWLTDISDCTTAPDARLSAFLPDERQHRLTRYRHLADRVRCLTGGLSAVCAASQTVQCDISDVKLVTEAGRPPYAVTPAGKIYLSISHSGRYVLCAADLFPCGCDIEEVQDKRDELALARQFFHPAETAALEGIQSETARRDMFFILWTAKESYLKYTGEGLLRPLSSFSADIRSDRLSISENSGLFGKTWIPDTGYRASVFSHSDNIKIVSMSFSQLSGYFCSKNNRSQELTRL